MPGADGNIRWPVMIAAAVLATVVIMLPALGVFFFDRGDQSQQPAATAQHVADRTAISLVAPLWDDRVPAVQTAPVTADRPPGIGSHCFAAAPGGAGQGDRPRFAAGSGTAAAGRVVSPAGIGPGGKAGGLSGRTADREAHSGTDPSR